MDREVIEEIKRHFGIAAEEIRGDVRGVAEGVDLLTQHVEALEGRFEAFEGRFERFQQDVRREFAETQAMIRLSYSELDRRMRDLETDVGQLKARLDRLEAHG